MTGEWWEVRTQLVRVTRAEGETIETQQETTCFSRDARMLNESDARRLYNDVFSQTYSTQTDGVNIKAARVVELG